MYLDVRMSAVASSKLAATALLLAVFVELRCSEDRDNTSVVSQRECRAALEPFLVDRVNSEDYRNRLVSDAIIEQRSKVLALEELTFSHEPGQWGGPTLGKDLNPLKINLTRK